MRHPGSVRLCAVLAGLFLVGCGGGGDSGADPAPARGGSGGKADASGGAGGSASGGAGGSGGASSSGGAVATGGTAAAGSGGASLGSGGTSAPAPDASTDSTAADVAAPPSSPAPSGSEPYGCSKCTRLFNGKDLEGWNTAPGAWVVKDGVLASTGKAGDIYTKEDLGNYRIFFQVRHVSGGHKPCTVMFGKRPGDPTGVARGLGGAQFQPPLGGSWDYGVGGKFTQPNPRPPMDDTKWNQCEVVVKEAGSFRAACCLMGDAPCKTQWVLSWAGPGKKHPFDIMIHNPGLIDEYKEIWIERDPADDKLLSQ
jgi:hypothetical protein